MAVVTPSDVLQSCQAIDARIALASKALADVPQDPAFVSAWNARLRRWQEVRNQCSDWGSRFWNYKWGPILDDWRSNQLEWERQIEVRTGRLIPAPLPHRKDEEPALPFTSESSLAIGAAIGVLGILGLVALVRRR